MPSIKNIEESFAPNAHDTSDASSCNSCENYEYPVRRYVTRSANAEEIQKNLKSENLKQVRSRLKKEESEQVRYLSLDNATKEIEILEFKAKIERLEKIVKVFENFEEVMKKFEKNASTYKSLIADVNIKDYKELMNNEVQKIEIIYPPSLDIPELSNTVDALNGSYNAKKKIEDDTREKFHDAVFWKATASKRQMLRFIEFVFGCILLVVLVYYFFKD